MANDIPEGCVVLAKMLRKREGRGVPCGPHVVRSLQVHVNKWSYFLTLSALFLRVRLRLV